MCVSLLIKMKANILLIMSSHDTLCICMSAKTDLDLMILM